MIAPILIPLAILGGMDGVEPLRASVPLCEKPKLKEIVIRREERLVGVTAAARRLGCTQANVSMVVRGVRKSRSLLERMRKMNIRVEA